MICGSASSRKIFVAFRELMPKQDRQIAKTIAPNFLYFIALKSQRLVIKLFFLDLDFVLGSFNPHMFRAWKMA